jgi:hypothetical protein
MYPMLTFDHLDTAARVLMGLVGLVMTLHYSAMAGYINRAPTGVRFGLLPTLVGFGVFMIGCAVKGYTATGLIAMALSSLPLLTLYMTVWAAGLHVSDVFEKQAVERDRERMRYYLGEAINGYEYVAQDLSDSRMDQLQQSGKERMRA